MDRYNPHEWVGYAGALLWGVWIALLVTGRIARMASRRGAGFSPQERAFVRALAGLASGVLAYAYLIDLEGLPIDHWGLSGMLFGVWAVGAAVDYKIRKR